MPATTTNVDNVLMKDLKLNTTSITFFHGLKPFETNNSKHHLTKPDTTSTSI